MAMANIWLVSSANMASASNGRRSGKLQVYRSLRKIIQGRVWKIQRDRKTYPNKIQCFHWNPYYIFVSSSFEVLEVLATAPGSVVTWSAGITDTLAPSFWSFRGWNVDFWIDDLWFSWYNGVLVYNRLFKLPSIFFGRRVVPQIVVEIINDCRILSLYLL